MANSGIAAGERLLALLGGKQCRNTLLFHQEHDELRRFAVARVTPDDVNVIRAFIESFAGFERDGARLATASRSNPRARRRRRAHRINGFRQRRHGG